MFFAAQVFCQNTSEDWRKANQLYQKSQYEQAAEAYRSLIKSDPDNPYLHYDLANSYFKAGANAGLGLAIAEFWRAYQLLPRDSDIRYNFEFALKRAGESLVPSGVPDSLHYAFYLLSESEISGIFWIGWWICLLSGSLWLLSKESLRLKLLPWIGASSILLALSGSWWGLRYVADIPSSGVVLEQNAEARSGPGSNFSVSFNAPTGRRVSILSQQGDWVEINMFKEALRGWVPSKAVEKINAG